MSTYSVFGILQTPVLYLCAVLLIFTGFYTPGNYRDYLLLPIWLLLAGSFNSINYLAFVPGLSYQFGMFIIITFLWTPLLFRARKNPITVEIKHNRIVNWNLKIAYETYNNPRMLAKGPTPKVAGRAPLTKRELVSFALHRLFRPATIFAFKTCLTLAVAPFLAKSSLQSFAPSREHIVRRLIDGTVSTNDLFLRMYLSTIWIVESVSQLEISHALAAVLFVSILEVDRPEEWPPLFGNPLDAYTLGRFWSKFWHQLFSPIALVWGHFLADVSFPCRTPLWVKKMFPPFFVFTVSGLAHAAIGWKMKEAALERDVYFFWANFLAVAFEVALSRIWQRVVQPYLQRHLGIKLTNTGLWVQIGGYLWVALFFFWVTPRLIYPKIFREMIAKMPLLAWLMPVE